MRIDLVAAVYLANVYMGNMHLKCTPNNIAAWLLHLMYMMCPRSSSGGRNTNASVTITVTVCDYFIFQVYLDEQILQFSGLGFVSLCPFTMPRFFSVYACDFCVILSYCIMSCIIVTRRHGAYGTFLQCFDTVGWVI